MSSKDQRLAEAAAAFLSAWRRGEDETSAVDEASNLDDALAEWRMVNDGLSVRQVDATIALAALHPDVWFDNATHFSCSEAEAIAEFMSAFDMKGDLFLGYHATDDDEGDSHEPIVDPNGIVIGVRRREGDDDGEV